MRPLIYSLSGCLLLLSVAWAQTSSSSNGGSAPQLPVGQVFKDFQFPLYQDGQLKATMAAVQARGITLNRAETTDLRIDIYENGKVTTTITSPTADLYVADRKMRTKNTVLIERADMEASSQVCDFDLTSKNYLLQQKVKVILKNFSPTTPGMMQGQSGKPLGVTNTVPAARPNPVYTSLPVFNHDSGTSAGGSLGGVSLDMPGATASGTNAAPENPRNVTP